jgi:glycosyltransferase involved in cell wall biosynthesis
MLLTISIPTFNRASHLDFLLRVLESELRGFEDKVAVYVSDNASTDDTPAVTARYSSQIANFKVRRNEKDVGSANNFKEVYSAPQSTYVWIMGDDDAPIQGSLPLIVDALERLAPDILYVPAVGRSDIAAEYPKWKAARSRAVMLPREDFAAAIHAMFTFISACILRKTTVAPAALQEALRLAGPTNLTQLTWVYETLNQGTRFVHMRDELLLGTSGANSGYGVLNTLLVDQARLVDRLLSRQPATQRAILFRANLCYFPWLIWYMRKDRLGTFDVQSRGTIEVPEILNRMPSFKYVVTPIWVFPERIAGLFYHLSRILKRLCQEYDRHISFRQNYRLPTTSSS